MEFKQPFVCLWILPCLPVTLRQSSFVRNGKSSSQRIVKLTRNRGPRVSWKCLGGENDEKGKDKGDDEGGKPDWDSSWDEFSKRRQGGVFGLAEESLPEQRQRVDKQTDRLTSAWSNDIGFLVGIGVIGLIAAFYVYVYTSGGI